MIDTPILLSARWAEPNRNVLQAALKRWGEDDVNRVAVFDFDNTCVFHDAGEAVLRHQLSTLNFRLSPDVLADHIPTEIDGVRSLASGHQLAALREDVVSSYRKLWRDDLGRLDPDLSGTNDAIDLFARLAGLYSGIESTPGLGARVAYPWMCGLLAGFDDDAIAALAVDAWKLASVEPIGRAVVTSTSAGQAGQISFDYLSGVRALPELSELHRALVDAGVTPYIVTASEQGLIRALALEVGLPVMPAHVFGVRLEVDDAGRRLPGLNKTYPMTFRSGKHDVIQRFLPTPPVLVAGDSDTDFEMLTGFPETEIRLIFDRGERGDIGSLYDGTPRNLVQGRDEPHGCLHPKTRSTQLEPSDG